ncbi:hypothetical protein IAQ61_006580 [Plenodomus lingam]|uniref:uncharacterized protein n=1 Tax=Leptosphaeria maculans TaxID=5022 RepID=UPI00332D3AED|nr:hypothetical protein IAQ61_006580 [Plenodomus lingam]
MVRGIVAGLFTGHTVCACQCFYQPTTLGERIYQSSRGPLLNPGHDDDLASRSNGSMTKVKSLLKQSV